MAKPMMKLTDKEKKMGDALMMTRKGKEVMNAQKRMEGEKEMQRRKKQAAADKLLGIGMKEGGMAMKSRGFGLPDSMLPRGTKSRRPQAPSQTTKPSASQAAKTSAPQAVKSTPPETKTVKLNEKPKYVKLEAHKKGGKVMKKADKAGRALVKKSADTMGRAMVKKAGGGKCYAKGGSVSARADGVAKKGKTHTKMVAMNKGGYC